MKSDCSVPTAPHGFWGRWKLVLLGALVVCAILWVVMSMRSAQRPAAKPEPVQPDRPGSPAVRQVLPGLRDVALESGIDFRMSFLPQEQGEAFKVNLYDHGSGLAI